ncbi:snRNA-activating protein complex subunit 1 [Gryllus bimaculatus]|nr:snRNA-activating protein complex subunit 1 [Gryllus bimaculatus]
MSYLAIGARTDCHHIVEKFARLNTLRYHDFAEIWRQLKFPYIYFGHHCLEELIEFTEEVLRIAKEKWLKSEALNEQTGGLYTLYGLYLKQPTDGLVKVRITPKDYELVEKFHEQIKVGGHHDANYILARMHIIGAFRFCISEYPYGVEKSYRAYHEDDRSLWEIKDEPLYIKRLQNDDIFNKLEDAFKQYHKSKCELDSEPSENPPSLLSYVDSLFGQKLKQQFRTITQVNDDDDDDGDGGHSDNDSSRAWNSPVANASTSDSKIKLPWWMLPITRPHMKKLSDSESDSDCEDNSENDNSKLTSSKNSREALNVALGMSGDEEDDINDYENRQTGNIYEFT